MGILALLQDLIKQISDPVLRNRIMQETNKLMKQKKFGLVFEEHLPECTPLYDVPVKVGAKVALKTGYVSDIYTVLKIDDTGALCDRRENHEQKVFSLDDLVVVAEFGEPIYPTLQMLDSVENAPDGDLWHTLIEADNYHALQLLAYLYAEKVDCIYIDPPYNTGAKDWKYNNDYVDSNDQYRHSKWLSMMEKRLKLAKKLLNPKDSVLIVTIDEKEYLHLGCLLEEMFPEARMQTISTVINRKGVAKSKEFSRCDEYLVFLFFGEAGPALTKDNMLDAEESKKGKPASGTLWLPMRRAGTNSLRKDRPKLFYPIYVNVKTEKIIGTGAVPVDAFHVSRNFAVTDQIVEIWPIKSSGEEGRWQLQSDTVLKRAAEGTVRATRKNEMEWVVQYLNEGALKEIRDGSIGVIGRDSNGVLIVERNAKKNVAAKSVWNRTSHDATAYGTNLINKILGQSKFSFPKSVYAVRDSVNFAVANKPDALILDFFAGSGTTLHAVNLLNAKDGGHRRCIMVTNNEVSVDESKRLAKAGHKPCDEEWNKLGIARYVTWPRTVCSIEGHDVDGSPLKGSYLDSDIPMADGFKANAAFFKLSFLDKNAIALGRQFKELLPVLWMKGGAIGRCPVLEGNQLPGMLILPRNKMSVLLDEMYYTEFAAEMAMHPEIQTVFIVTDSEAAYKSMIRDYADKDCYQLYRDYLDNFRINMGR